MASRGRWEHGRLLNQGRRLLVEKKGTARVMRTIRSGAELASLNAVGAGGVIRAPEEGGILARVTPDTV